MSDTIAAIATGNVISAIGIIRLSGDDTLAVIDRVFRPSSGKAMSESPNRKLVYGALCDTDGQTLDLCLCTISRGPSSYTGEDTAELQCHGSPTVLRAGLQALFAAGARQALAGEFSKRAFLNHRMDLTQAEAVIDLIHAESAQEAKNAVGQLGGAVLRRAQGVYDTLADIASHYHAVIDYPDEDIEDFELTAYTAALTDSIAQLQRLLDTFARGSVLHSGVPSVILGRPNAGKSSLLNALLGYDRAIVTDIPGTTRDTIEERVTLGGVLLRLTDTAGLHATADPVEALGVGRALDAAGQAALAIAVFDASEPLTADDTHFRIEFPYAMYQNADGKTGVSCVKPSATLSLVIDDAVPGDVNGDGAVDDADAAMIYAYANGKLTLTDRQLLLADVDGSGKVDAKDAAQIYNAYLAESNG